MTTPTPAHVEAVAKAGFEDYYAHPCAWDRLDPANQKVWRQQARVMITAYEQAKEKA